MSNFPLLPAEPSLFSKKALHMSVNKAQYQSKHRQTDGLTDVIITADDLVSGALPVAGDGSCRECRPALLPS